MTEMRHSAEESLQPIEGLQPVKSHPPVRVNLPVFLGSASVILLLGLLTVLFPQGSQRWLSHAQSWV